MKALQGKHYPKPLFSTRPHRHASNYSTEFQLSTPVHSRTPENGASQGKSPAARTVRGAQDHTYM